MKESQVPLKEIALSIRDFALPVPRTGSIDSNSGYGRAMDGQEIHLRVQDRRAREDDTYEAEVPIEARLEREGFLFKVGGRMDGLFRQTPRIEEIKSTFSVPDLVRRLTDTEYEHPYNLQLLTYGYFYQLEHGVIPKLSFHLVSTRSQESHDLELELDVEEYEAWMERRLAELVEEARKAEKRAARRRKIAQEFPFPFETPRRGQRELIQMVGEGFAAKNSEDSELRPKLWLQAPTGLGKTAGVLYPALQEALSRGQRVIYVTPKNSQHLVAEDAITRFQDTGSAVKSLTLTAKSKICFKNEPLCNPEYCEFAKDYYGKVAEHKLVDQLAKKKKLRAKHFKDIGEEYQVCPFELQLDTAHEADTIICDYNYVFAPRSSFGRLAASHLDQEGKPNLVIDEAHNLPGRAMDYYSPALSSVTLGKMREDFEDLPMRFRREAEELLDGCVQAIIACRPADPAAGTGAGESAPRGFGRSGGRSGGGTKIDPPVEPFLEQDGLLRAFLSRYLDSDVEIQPRDPVLRLCFYWSEFTEALQFVQDPEHDEFFTTFQPHPTGGIVRITCCDASKMLKVCYDEYENVAAFSATLKPFEYYTRLSGLEPEKVKTAEFASPFERAQRKVLIIPQVSSRYSERERNIPRIADAIQRIAALRRGNYLAFFPSFDFMERVMAFFVPPEDFLILRQEREMKAADVETVLDELRSRARPTILFAVQGGVFSEGVDYPGEMVIGAFVVGSPLPSFDLEREEMKAYYERKYKAGFDYAYTFPAMAKAVQAAGRVIRTETDRGLIVLMDNRFLLPNYSQSMPKDWFDEGPGELVSRSILGEVSRFWSEGDASVPF